MLDVNKEILKQGNNVRHELLFNINILDNKNYYSFFKSKFFKKINKQDKLQKNIK